MTAPQNEQTAFLAAIRDRPEEDGPRLLFANWLEEQGDPRGELLRVQCALDPMDEDDPRREELERREAELLRQHGKAWRGRPPKWVEVGFERGLLSLRVGAEVLARAQASLWFTAHQSWVSTLNIGGLLTDAGLEHLAGLTQLRYLNLFGTEVTDAGLKHLAGLKQLGELDLGSTRVTGAGLKYLARLPQLRKLWLYRTGVTDAGLKHLAGLTQLRELDLCYTQVKGAGLEHLAGLTQLQKLYLFVSRMTKAGIRKLKKALPRCHITRH